MEQCSNLNLAFENSSGMIRCWVLSRCNGFYIISSWTQTPPLFTFVQRLLTSIRRRKVLFPVHVLVCVFILIAQTYSQIQ